MAGGSFLDNVLNAVRSVYANGTLVTRRDAINFRGGVTVTDDAVTGRTDVEINVGSIYGDSSGLVTVTATSWDYAYATGCTARGRMRSVVTTDATPTDLFSIALPEGTSVVTVEVDADQIGHSNGACYKLKRRFRRASGVVTPGSIVTIEEDEDDATWGGVTIDHAGTTCRVRVTGKSATTIRWAGLIQINEVSA